MGGTLSYVVSYLTYFKAISQTISVGSSTLTLPSGLYHVTDQEIEPPNLIIDNVHDLRSENKNITTQLCLTLNIQNVFYLEELINWALPKKFNSIYFNMMHSPDHMSIAYMTEEAKKIVIDKLLAGKWTPSHKQEIENIVQFIKNGPGSDGVEFVKRMQQTDAYRNQNFYLTHPEIASAMGYK